MSSPSYTEFNKDMFLCNNFDNTSGVYYKGSTVLSKPTILTNATFYSLTDIRSSTELKSHHKESLIRIINPNTPAIPYDISSAVYNYLNNSQKKKSYANFLDTKSHEWIYTFGQLVKNETTATASLYDKNAINLTTSNSFIYK